MATVITWGDGSVQTISTRRGDGSLATLEELLNAWDAFREHKPLFMLEPLFMNDLKRLMNHCA